MVGVPGKSKGCGTCKRRKKKCGLERPVCSRCQKAGIICTGYNVSRTFINYDPTSTDKAIGVACGGDIKVALRHSFNLADYEDQFLSHFWDIYLPGGPPLGDGFLKQFTVGSWVTVAHDISSQESAVRKALLAVCMILIAQNDDKQWVAHESVKLYTSALQEVRKSLSSPSKCHSDATLVASRALSAYELFSGVDNGLDTPVSRPSNWVNHHLGQTAIVTRRGPEHYVQGRAHRLFADGRLQLAIAACLHKKRTFLAEPEWSTVPWSQHPKSSKDNIIDILVQVPALLEDVDILAQSIGSAGESSIAHRIRDTYKRINTDLTCWQATKFPETQLSNLQERRQQNQDPTTRDVLTAHLLTLFWAACLVTHRTFRIASLLSPDVADPDFQLSSSFAALSDKASLDGYCEKIAGIVGILFHPAAGIYGAQFALFPIGCSLAYLTKSQQLQSDTADKLLELFLAQTTRKALRKFVLRAVKESLNFGTVSTSTFSTTSTPSSPSALAQSAKGQDGEKAKSGAIHHS